MYSDILGFFAFEVEVREGALVVIEAKVLEEEEESKQAGEEATDIGKYINEFKIRS